jgi:hypothetical protein
MEDKNLEYPISTAHMKYFRPTMAQLMSEANKYLTLGNLIDAVKDYKENETFLDIQLRKFKESQTDKEISEEIPDFIEPFSKVKDLPEPLKKLVELRTLEYSHKFCDLDQDIGSSFMFKDTPEGHVFWEKIYNTGDLRQFKKLKL